MAITLNSLFAGNLSGSDIAGSEAGFGGFKLGDLVALANGNPGSLGDIGGAAIDDISNKSLPIRIFEKKMVDDLMVDDNQATCRAVAIHGEPYSTGQLVCIWRRGSNGDAPGGQSGSMIFLFDISNADDTQWGIDVANWPTNHHFINTRVIEGSGTHDGGSGSAVLTDTTAAWSDGQWVGYTLKNTTDGSETVVTANTATTITGVLSGGTDNDWDSIDAYTLEIRLALFSDMQLVGDDAYVFGQESGAFKYDVTNLAAGPLANTDHTLYPYEAQGGCVTSTHTWCANYAHGVRVLANATMLDLPAGAGIIIKDIDPVSGKSLRPWDFVPSSDERYIFAAFNANPNPSPYTAEGSPAGLQVYDNTDPDNPFLIESYYIPNNQRDVFIDGSRDQACLRIVRVDNLVILANRQMGYDIWNVQDPLNPIHLGSHFSNLQTAGIARDMVSGLVAWREGGEYFMYNQDGYHITQGGVGVSGTKKTYATQLLFDGNTTMAIGGTEITGLGSVGEYNWNIASDNPRTTTPTLSDEGDGAPNGLVTHVDTAITGAITVNNFYYAQRRAGGGANEVAFTGFLLDAEDVSVAGEWTPSDSATAAALTPAITDTIFPGDVDMAVYTIPVNAVIPAGHKIVVAGQLIGVAGGSINFANLEADLTSGGRSNSASDLVTDDWAGTGPRAIGMWFDYTVNSGSPTLTTPFPIGTNNGPLFSATSSDTIATVEAADFLNDNVGWASLLKTDDVVIIECSDGTKMYNVTVNTEQRIISLSTGLVIA